MVFGGRPIVFNLKPLNLRWQSALAKELPDLKTQQARRLPKRRTPIDREFLLSVLEASSTKREAKDYIRKFDINSSPFGLPPGRSALRSQQHGPIGIESGGYLNPSAVELQPAFAQSRGEPSFGRPEGLHIALVVVRRPCSIDDDSLTGFSKTLTQLGKLGLASLVILDNHEERGAVNSSKGDSSPSTRRSSQISRWVDNINNSGLDGARAQMISGSISLGKDRDEAGGFNQGYLTVENGHPIVSSLRRGIVTFVSAEVIDYRSQASTNASTDDLVLCLVKHLAGLAKWDKTEQRSREATQPQTPSATHTEQTYLDRLIVLDPEGGLPAKDRHSASHIFVNLEQEYERIMKDLVENQDKCDGLSAKTSHQQNLALVKRCLQLLPPAASAVITRPDEAAHLSESAPSTLRADTVGTRKRRNPLIHSLLTDKPMFSSSLPARRISKLNEKGLYVEARPSTTFLKNGLPVTILPDVLNGSWKYPSTSQVLLDIDDPRVNVARLVTLIEDSFSRQLDAKHYFSRIKGKLAGLIIAGEYEGGALLTWELPPGVPDDDSEESKRRMIPYLDKFAVLRRSQGSGGVADVVFKAMVTDCFPEGVCWRSRRDNPVNKWYFERARGTWKIPDSNWTMFWTTPDLTVASPPFMDYEAVCRSVQPSWADAKAAD